MSGEAQVQPEDALQVAQRALSKINDLDDDFEELQSEYDKISEDLAAVKLRLSEINDNRSYESLTLDEKIGIVREHAFEKAVSERGRTTLDYSDIMWEVFEGEPGSKHCYKLMRRAAGETETEQKDMTEGAVGFAVRDPANGSRHLAVDAERAKRSGEFFPENKTLSVEGVRE